MSSPTDNANNDRLATFVQQVRLWRMHRQRGVSLYHQGDPADQVYRVDEGWVRLIREGEDGQRRIFAFVGPGEYFGANLQARDCSAEACVDSQLTVIPMAGLLRIGSTDPSALLALFGSCSSHYLDRLGLDGGQASADEKLRWFSVRMGMRVADGRGGGVCLPFSQVDIANYLGMAPETLCRAIAQLCATGEIERRRRRLWIGEGDHSGRPLPDMDADRYCAARMRLERRESAAWSSHRQR